MIKKLWKKKPSFASIEKLLSGLVETDKKPGKKDSAGADDPPWIKYAAILAAALAGLAGFLVVKSSTLTNQAIYESDQAILAQAQASDAWGEYQADSIKARIVETQLLPSSPLGAEDRATLAKTDEDLRSRQPQSKQEAAAKTAERDQHVQATQKYMAQKGMLEYASLAAQLGIVLASLTMMVKKSFVLWAGILAGIAAACITGWATLASLL